MNGFFTYQLEPAPPHDQLDQVYQSGRILVYNSESVEDEPVSFGFYRVPFEVAAHFEAFIESLETDYPIMLSVGSDTQCVKAATIGSSVADITSDLLHESDTFQLPIKSRRSLEPDGEE